MECGHTANHCLVAIKTVIEHDIAADLAHLNRLREILEGERARVRKSILRLSHVLADDVMRSVATVAGGNRLVAAVRPTVVFVAHDMTVDARLWVV